MYLVLTSTVPNSPSKRGDVDDKRRKRRGHNSSAASNHYLTSITTGSADEVALGLAAFCSFCSVGSAHVEADIARMWWFGVGSAGRGPDSGGRFRLSLFFWQANSCNTGSDDLG